MFTITFWYICFILYNYLLIHLLHTVQLPSNTSAAYCTITFRDHLLHILWLQLPFDTSAAYCMITVAFWYLCCILCSYLLLHLLHTVQLPSDTSASYYTITFWYICCILYNYLLIHLLHIVQLPSEAICCTLYDYSCLLITLLHTVQLPSDTSAAYCTITFWYICCILCNYLLRPSVAHCMITVAFWYLCCILCNYLLIHLLHIVQLPSDTSAAYCAITFWYMCCILCDYSCLRYHLLHTLRYLLIASPVHNTISWHHLLHTVLSYYEWCSREHETF